MTTIPAHCPHDLEAAYGAAKAARDQDRTHPMARQQRLDHRHPSQLPFDAAHLLPLDAGRRPPLGQPRRPAAQGQDPQQRPQPFTIEGIQTLLESGIYTSTRTMVGLHYYLGLRVSEIARVHGRDINWDRRTLTTTGKGGKEVTLPVPAAAWMMFLSMPRQA